MMKESKRNTNIIVIFLILILTVSLGFYLINNRDTDEVSSNINKTPDNSETSVEDEKTSMANPASANCEEKGGQLVIKAKPSGDQYGVCVFDENRQCEEWALMRGECPVGGIKITGYLSDEEIYCAITGGLPSLYNDESEEGECNFTNGSSCDLSEYYNGLCDSNTNESEEVTAQAKFDCKDEKTIRAVFYKDKVDLSLSDGRTLDLNQSISGSGARYINADETIVFWNKGNTAFLEENDDTTYADCVAE